MITWDIMTEVSPERSSTSPRGTMFPDTRFSRTHSTNRSRILYKSTSPFILSLLTDLSLGQIRFVRGIGTQTWYTDFSREPRPSVSRHVPPLFPFPLPFERPMEDLPSTVIGKELRGLFYIPFLGVNSLWRDEWLWAIKTFKWVTECLCELSHDSPYLNPSYVPSFVRSTSPVALPPGSPI